MFHSDGIEDRVIHTHIHTHICMHSCIYKYIQILFLWLLGTVNEIMSRKEIQDILKCPISGSYYAGKQQN